MTTPPGDDPLDLARVQFRHAVAIGDMAGTSPDADVRAYIEGWGKKQHDAAEMAAQFALVSIAGDLREIADYLHEIAAHAYLTEPASDEGDT